MSKKSSLVFWTLTLSLIVAIGAHIYLTNHHYELKYGAGTTEGLCNINEKFNCNRTTTSAYSEIFGVAISIFGGLVNLALLFMILGARFPILAPDTRKQLASPIKIMSLGVFAVSLFMGSISLFVLNTICPMCSLTYLMSLITLATAWMYFDGKPSIGLFEIKTFAGVGVFTLAFGFFLHQTSLRPYGGKEMMEILNLQYQDFSTRAPKNFTTHKPLTMFGNENAKIQIVEFADYLCGHCANAYPIIHNFLKSHPDVEFKFQAFPLDGACNSAIQRSEGTRCLLAKIAQCAGDQGRTWETQEWIFNNQPKLYTQEKANSMLAENAESLGLDMTKLQTCIDDPQTLETIKKQAEAGIEAGVTGTPSLYINGKKVPTGFTIPLLEKIYKSLQ